jgi:hypothetical protein
MSKSVITLTPTIQVFECPSGTVVRCWTGTSDNGLQLEAYIAAVGVHQGQDASLVADFENGLKALGDRLVDHDAIVPPPSIN